MSYCLGQWLDLERTEVRQVREGETEGKRELGRTINNSSPRHLDLESSPRPSAPLDINEAQIPIKTCVGRQ